MRRAVFHFFIVCLLAGTALAGNIGIVLATRKDLTASAYGDLVAELKTAVQGAGLALTVSSIQAKSESDVGTAVAALASQGLTDIFVAGHSMTDGAVFAQNWVKKNSGSVRGLILLAAFLQRTHRPDFVDCLAKHAIAPKKSLSCPLGCLDDGVHDCHGANHVSFPVPVLTLGGELDGVVRIGRFAEAYHTQHNLSGMSSSQFPVIVLPGLNHAGLLTGTLPAAITSRDLKSEIKVKSTTAVAQVVSAFVQVCAGAGDTSAAKSSLEAWSASTGILVGSLVKALVEQEGSWFVTGADDEHGASAWAGQAQQLMAEPLPESYSWSTSNAFHLLSDEEKIPPYYRGKHRADVSVSGNTVTASTVAQLRFIKLSTTDTDAGLNGEAIIEEEKQGIATSQKDIGEDYVSALEIGTKLVSRQLVFNKTGHDAPESLDDGDRCATINQAAYNWALAAVSDSARARFQSYGVPMRMAADKKPVIPAGPWWIWTYLDMSMSKDNSALDVTSYFAFFSLTADPYGAGNHYCKLLSPARAVEWILTDGLRLKYHI